MPTAESRTTTIRLPLSLYDQAKTVVEKESRDRNRISLNDLFVSAIATYLRMHKRRQIDAAFAGMAEDSNYQKEAMLMTREFEQSDWEALKRGDEGSERKPAHARRSSR